MKQNRNRNYVNLLIDEKNREITATERDGVRATHKQVASKNPPKYIS